MATFLVRTRRLINAYETFKQNKPQWFNEVEIFTIWDDHDYGMNDGGGDYKYKVESQKLFNDFGIFHKMIQEDIEKAYILVNYEI